MYIECIGCQMLEVASKQQKKTTKSNSNLSQRTCTKFKI